MADTGWQFPGTVNTSYVGGSGFNSPDNVKLNDGANADWSGPKFDDDQQGDGPLITPSNFGFSIPTGYVIQGIETRIEGYTNVSIVSELAYLTVTSIEKRNDWSDIPTSAPGNTHVYGSLTDKWGAALTWDIVNASAFGWTFMIYDAVSPLSMTIDYMQMKIYYEPPPPIIIAMGT